MLFQIIHKASAYLMTGLFGRVIIHTREWNNTELYNVESRLTLQERLTTILISTLFLKVSYYCRYGSSADADLSIPFDAYKESLATSNSDIFVPEPLPIYQQKGSNSRKHAIDIAFSLLQLAVGQIRMDTFADLGQLLLPEARVPESLNSLESWLMLQILRAVGALSITPATTQQVYFICHSSKSFVHFKVRTRYVVHSFAEFNVSSGWRSQLYDAFFMCTLLLVRSRPSPSYRLPCIGHSVYRIVIVSNLNVKLITCKDCTCWKVGWHPNVPSMPLSTITSQCAGTTYSVHQMSVTLFDFDFDFEKHTDKSLTHDYNT